MADEAFFTGTAAEVLPIRELDGRQIGSGVRGELTTKLQGMYFDAVKGVVRRTSVADTRRLISVLSGWDPLACPDSIFSCLNPSFVTPIQ